MIKRLLLGLLSVLAIVVIVMILIYTCMSREMVFAGDPNYSHKVSNERIAYEYTKWKEYGYVDYITYADYLLELRKNGEIDEETRVKAVAIAFKEKDANGNDNDSEIVIKYKNKFREYYESKGYTVQRVDAKMQTSTKPVLGGKQLLFAYRDIPITTRLWKYLTGLVSVDNIHYASGDVGERGLTFTLHDPVYGGEKFSPAIMGNGTKHKYLLYFDDKFPFIHQNLITINLATSYNINPGEDVFDTMTKTQGNKVLSMVTYPTGFQEETAGDLHSATYVEGSLAASKLNQERFLDDYTNLAKNLSGKSKMFYSFVIGIIAVALAYLLGIPLGILMARRKDKIADKLGTIYIVFIMAVPSLAYIFMFKAIGAKAGLEKYVRFNTDTFSPLYYILPIVSLALPSVANLMKWIRRYMIDQQNSDYVKFARSGGLSEKEIFSKHILKNAIIPIVHGIPASVLGALTGAIITERVYYVPGVGNVLTEAISRYDNSVIVGITLFYSVLSVLSLILGDIFMAMVDPRISFSEKAR